MAVAIPKATLKELAHLAIPLMLILFSGSMMGFCDRWFLGHYSLESLEAVVNATNLCGLFQLPCMRIAVIAQVFVGYYLGANRSTCIGSCIWQMIWFALLSMIVTVPLGFVAKAFFFSGTSIEGEASIYFNCLMAANFLFPLGIALSSFYIGLGKTKIVTLATFASQILNILLDYLLIFGIKDVFPPLGILGAAIATITAQSLFCFILFKLFIREDPIYGSRDWRLKKEEFLKQLSLGSPRAAGKLIIIAVGAAITRAITLKGGDYLLILSFGSSLYLLFSFLNEGMSQAIITIGSQLIGAKEWSLIKKLIQSACIFLFGILTLLSIPFFLYPEHVIGAFFKQSFPLDVLQFLKLSCYWLWFYFLFEGLAWIGLSLLIAGKDTLWQMAIAASSIALFYPFVLLLIGQGIVNPDKFWLIMASNCLLSMTLYFLRLKRYSRSLIRA